jgi:hypothetical protein
MNQARAFGSLVPPTTVDFLAAKTGQKRVTILIPAEKVRLQRAVRSQANCLKFN